MSRGQNVSIAGYYNTAALPQPRPNIDNGWFNAFVETRDVGLHRFKLLDRVGCNALAKKLKIDEFGFVDQPSKYFVAFVHLAKDRIFIKRDFIIDCRLFGRFRFLLRED